MCSENETENSIVNITKGEWYTPEEGVTESSAMKWESNDPDVVGVNETSGEIYGVGEGSATVTGSSKKDPDVNVEIEVEVTPSVPEPECVIVTPPTVRLKVGESASVSAEVCPPEADGSVSWRVNVGGADVILLSGSSFTAKKSGVATVIATATNGVTGSCGVIVEEAEILAESVTISPNQIKLIGIHKSGLFSATVLPTNVTNSGVEWSSNNPAVATVNPNSGLVTSQGIGTAIITATAIDGSGKHGKAVVTVEEIPSPESVTVCPDTLCLRVGDWSLLDANVCPEGTDQTVTWHSSDECVAVVYEDGWVEATGEGNATITATTTGDCPKQASCAVTVCRVPVISIKFPSDEITLDVDQRKKLNPIVCPDNATNRSVLWSSSDPNVASVDSDGYVTAHLAGSATITATTVDGGFVDNCIVNVYDPYEVEYVNLTKDNSGKYTIFLTKFRNNDFYFQSHSEEDGSWGDLYALSNSNITWLNETYNSYYENYISKGKFNTSLIDHRVWLARNKLINTIESGVWDVSINSDEFYGMWMHYTKLEVSYSEATFLLAQMVDTANIIVSTIYQAVVTAKSIVTLAKAKKTISAAGYKSMSSAYKAFSGFSDSQAISEGITDSTTYSGTRRTWRQSELRAAEDLTGDYLVNKAFVLKDGKPIQVPYGTAKSQRPDYYNTITNKIIEVKNYNITTAAGRKNLANNINSQYNSRLNMFPNADIKFKVDVYGQNYTQEMLDDLLDLVSAKTGNNKLIDFMFD